MSPRLKVLYERLKTEFKKIRDIKKQIDAEMKRGNHDKSKR